MGMGVHVAAPPPMHTCVRSRVVLLGRRSCKRRTRPRAASVRARVCACAIGRPRIRADTCERVPSAWTAVGSSRRRSTVRRRSTRTSARGTPRRSPSLVAYAPPFRPGGAPPRAGRARRVVDAAPAVVRGGTADARAHVCAETCGPSHARVSTCVGITARTKDGMYVCMYVCIYMDISLCMHYTCIYRYMCTCVRDGYGRACGCAGSHAHVRAIARADDAAVAITRACVYFLRDI